jgi:predicted AAA+ superfamily ATPase
MDSLETFYQSNYKIKSIPRKEQIKAKKTFILAPRNCGMTYFIFDFLNTHFKYTRYLYIDCEDMRFKNLPDASDIRTFIIKHKIEALALDNYTPAFALDIEQISCEQIIIASCRLNEYRGFQTLRLHPLDFEQFLLFGNFSDAKIAFNHFIKHGNFPATVHLSEEKLIHYLQSFVRALSKDENKLFIRKMFYDFIGQKRSLLELYTGIKKQIKISKDSFYAFAKELEKSKEILFLPHYEKPKAAKKIYAYNPALFNAVSFSKKFHNTLSNFVFLELYYRFASVYYLDEIDFYVPEENLAVLCMPFVNESLISTKSARLIESIEKYRIKNIQIVTNSTEDILYLESVECEILPFYNWALCF